MTTSCSQSPHTHPVAAMIVAILLATATVFVSATDAGAAESPITAVAFAPSGDSVVVGSQAGLMELSWPELTPQRKIETALINVHDLAFSSDGGSLAAAGGTPSEDGHVEIFDWPGGRSVLLCTEHKDSVLGIAWNSNSSFASAGLDHVVRLWNATSGDSQQQLTGHSRGVSSVCFLPDDNTLVSAGLDQNLRVWDIAADKLVRTLNNHTREVHQLALRPGTEGLPMIASVSSDRTVRLWQPTIGRMVRFAQLDSVPLAVDWLMDGSRIVVATSDGHVLLIDPDTVEVLQDIPAVDGWAYAIDVHPTDGSLLVGGREGQLKRIVPDTPRS